MILIQETLDACPSLLLACFSVFLIIKSYECAYTYQAFPICRFTNGSNVDIKSAVIFIIFKILIDLTLTQTKEPSEVFCEKRYSQKFCKIQRKTHVPKSLFKQSCRPQAGNFIKKRLWHKCFPVIFAKFLETPFLQNTSRRLLLTKFFLKICAT